MRASGFAGLLALSLVIPSPATAQPVDEWVEGTHRICAYPIGQGVEGVRQYQVGVGETCPVYYPTKNTNSPPPPTARLSGEAVTDGIRVCRYSQRNQEWRFELAPDKRCPLTVGMFETQQRTANISR
jgi:hypothetical protein